MWVMTTDSGLINLDFVAQIVVETEWLRFYRLHTPTEGIADKPNRDLIGGLRCGSEEKARQRLFDLEEQLNAHVKKSLEQRGREVPQEHGKGTSLGDAASRPSGASRRSGPRGAS